MKISALPAVTAAGTDLLEVVQAGVSSRATASDIAATATNVRTVATGGTGVATLTAGYLVKGSGTSAVTASIIYDSGTAVGVGTASPNASAILDVQSTNKGLRLPNMTTVQKNAVATPAAGLLVFDTTLSKACVYTGAAWETVTSV